MPDMKNGMKRAPGGKRAGAGRKPSKLKALAAEMIAGTACDNLKKIQAIADDAAESGKVRLAALVYMVDRELGKPVAPTRDETVRGKMTPAEMVEAFVRLGAPIPPGLARMNAAHPN